MNVMPKIFLGVMPFWAPLNPPLGISVLKSYLAEKGFVVKNCDFNTNEDLWSFSGAFFNILKKAIPKEKHSNLHMIGYDLLSYYLMAFCNKRSSENYWNVMRTLSNSVFFHEIKDEFLFEIDELAENFYEKIEEVLLEEIAQNNPNVFGLSVYSPTLAPSIFAFKLIKDNFPAIKTIMGGGVFSDLLNPYSENFQRFRCETSTFIDDVVIGEGEVLFERILTGELAKKDYYCIKDLGGYIFDVNSAPIPDFSDFDLRNYFQQTTYLTRGCPYKCRFCSESEQWGQFRKKEIKRAVDEILSLTEKNKKNIFQFGDSLLNPIITDLSNALIESDAHVRWDAYIRVSDEVCSIDNVKKWRRAGFYRARLGIESGSSDVLKRMNKCITTQQIKYALRNLAECGIKTTTYWIVGFPGETEKDFSETIDLLVELKDYIYEADPHPFYYFPYGQNSSSAWKTEFGNQAVFQKETLSLIITQKWNLQKAPRGDVVNNRLQKFVDTCKKHGIPNPYTIREIFKADERWKSKFTHAGPSLVEFYSN
jgi:radical SAM superfamily enzyme YgiQ (UPF0313 family)